MSSADDGSLVALSDLRTAACYPWKYYYCEREDDREPSSEVNDPQSLAFSYLASSPTRPISRRNR